MSTKAFSIWIVSLCLIIITAFAVAIYYSPASAQTKSSKPKTTLDPANFFKSRSLSDPKSELFRIQFIVYISCVQGEELIAFPLGTRLTEEQLYSCLQFSETAIRENK